MNQKLVILFEDFDSEFVTNCLKRFDTTGTLRPKFVNYHIPLEQEGTQEKIFCDVIILPAGYLPKPGTFGMVPNYQQVYLSLSKGDRHNPKIVEQLKQIAGKRLRPYIPDFAPQDSPIRGLLYQLAMAYELRKQRLYNETLGKMHSLLDFDALNEAKLMLLNAALSPTALMALLNEREAIDPVVKAELHAIVESQEVVVCLLELKQDVPKEERLILVNRLQELIFPIGPSLAEIFSTVH